MALSPLLRRYDHVLLDLDGCVWIDDEPTPRAVEAVAELRAAGKGVAFVTNATRLATEEYVRKLWRLGFRASVEEVVTAGGALQHVLAEGFAGRSAFVIGAPAVHRHVEGAGLRIVNRSSFEGRADVVVAAAHEGFDYAELRAATQSVLRGAVLLGAGRDATGPMPDGPWPGTGAILAAIEAATGATAQVVGKPAPQLFLTALDRLGVAWVPPPAAAERPPSPALVVGDRLDSDVAGAHAAGLDGALVLSGSTSRAGVDVWEGPPPVAVAATLADLVLPAR